VVAAPDFDQGPEPASIDPHLRAKLRLLDADGRTVLAESHDLAGLRARFGERAAAAFARHAAQGMAQRGLVTFPDVPIPEQVPGAGGVPAWPALQDDGDSASLAVHADRAVAARLHPGGVRRLLAIALADKRKQARKQLPAQPKTALLYAAIESAAPRGVAADSLRADLVDGAFAALAADDAGDGGPGGIRDPQAFAARRDAIGKALFPEAMDRLRQAEAILALVADARATSGAVTQLRRGAFASARNSAAALSATKPGASHDSRAASSALSRCSGTTTVMPSSTAPGSKR
jgi:ATP-dependent helicase HrpA